MSSQSLDHDWQLRLAAFDALRRITDRSGGVITREQMTAGFDFKGERIAFADRGRGIWRPRALGSTGAALSVCSSAPKPGREAPYDDGATNDSGWLAYRYQRNGPDAWDNAAVRKAYLSQAPIIYFSGIVPGKFAPIFPVYVVDDELGKETFRLSSVGSIVKNIDIFESGKSEIAKGYMLRQVKQRLHQHKFREFVLEAYSGACTICRLAHVELLDAAHIIEDHDELGKPEVPNGLALCRIHHGAFDSDLLGISPDYRVHIGPKVLKEKDGPMLLHGLQEMHGKEIVPPRRKEWRPRAEYLEARFRRFEAA